MQHNGEAWISIVKISFSTISLGLEHHNRWTEISCSPPCYYFSLKRCSAACFTTLLRALGGQRPCLLRGQGTINKCEVISTTPPFVGPSSTWYCLSAASRLDVEEKCWLTDELWEASSLAQLSVAEPHVPGSRVALSACPITHLHIQTVDVFANTLWPTVS